MANPLFFKEPVALSAVEHLASTYVAPPSYEFAGKTNSVPLAMSEFEQVAVNYPIVFSSTDQPTCTPIAVLGHKDNENNFVNNKGTWTIGKYIPAYVRRFPFVFAENEENLILCIEADHIGKPGEGQNLFESNSEQTPIIKTALEFCKDYQAAMLQTADFIAFLKTNNLLVDQQVNIDMGNGETFSLGGFSIIDRDLYNKLEDDNDSTISSTYRSAVHSHFVSMSSWQTFSTPLPTED